MTEQIGLIPESWLQIEKAEIKRMQSAMQQALQRRIKDLGEADIEQRRIAVRRYFGDLMLPPSFPNGPYAADRWLNLYEMFTRIIDIKQDKAIVPDVDGKVPFSSAGLGKEAIIINWLVQKIQGSLSEEQRLRDEQLNDCFTNVTENQLTAVIDQIAQSGLSILPESPQEHWQRIMTESSSQR